MNKQDLPNEGDHRSEAKPYSQPRSYCVPYHTNYSKSHNTIRAIQQEGHNILANIIGMLLIPRNDKADIYS